MTESPVVFWKVSQKKKPISYHRSKGIVWWIKISLISKHNITFKNRLFKRRSKELTRPHQNASLIIQIDCTFIFYWCHDSLKIVSSLDVMSRIPLQSNHSFCELPISLIRSDCFYEKLSFQCYPYKPCRKKHIFIWIWGNHINYLYTNVIFPVQVKNVFNRFTSMTVTSLN